MHNMLININISFQWYIVSHYFIIQKPFQHSEDDGKSLREEIVFEERRKRNRRKWDVSVCIICTHFLIPFVKSTNK